jgi:hypothetical protein
MKRTIAGRAAGAGVLPSGEGDHIKAGINRAKLSPSFRKLAALFESVAATVSPLYSIAYEVSEGSLRDLSGEVRSLARPVAKSAPKTINRAVHLHAPQYRL